MDSAGNAYLTGDTSSSNFPLANAFQNTFGGGLPFGDAFVTKFNAAGALTYSTYLGGSNIDNGYGIAVDPPKPAFFFASACATSCAFASVGVLRRQGVAAACVGAIVGFFLACALLAVLHAAFVLLGA